MSDGKKDRGEALRSRLSKEDEKEETSEMAERKEREEISETANPEERTEIAETSENSDLVSTSETSETTETDGESVKARKNVNMYLPDQLVDELNIQYSELDARFQREHGRSMEKNRDYYPAVIEAGLTGENIESILELD